MWLLSLKMVERATNQVLTTAIPQRLKRQRTDSLLQAPEGMHPVTP